MSGDHDGVDPEKRSEDYRRFRRMMEGMSREDIRRMVEHLTEAIEANPRDTEALSARGWHTASWGTTAARRRTTAGSSPSNPTTRTPTSTEPAPTQSWRSTARRRRSPPPPSAWPQRRRGALQPWGVQGGAGQP